MSSAYSASSALSSHRRRPADDSSGDEGEDADEFYDPQEYPADVAQQPQQQQHHPHPHLPHSNSNSTSLHTPNSATSFKPAYRGSDEKELSGYSQPFRVLDSSTRSTRSQSTASQSSTFSHHAEPASPSPDTLPSFSSASPLPATQGVSPSSSPVPPTSTPTVPVRPGRSAVVISTASTMSTPSPSPALATPSSSSSSSASSANHTHHVRSASFNMPGLSPSPSASSASAIVTPATSPVGVQAATPSSVRAFASTSQQLPSSGSNTSLKSLVPALSSPPHNPAQPASFSATSIPSVSSSSATLPTAFASTMSSVLPASSSFSRTSPSVSGVSHQPAETVIRNLDTNESCNLSAANTHFPELSQAMTIAQLEAMEQTKAGKDREPATTMAAVATSASAVGGGAEEAAVAEVKISETEVAERRKTLGFLGKLAKSFSISSMKTSTATGNEGRVKVKAKHCEVDVLSELYGVQTIVEHTGPIWAVAVSHDGQFVATGGQDSCVRVWVVTGSLAHRQMESKQQQQQQAATPHHSHNSSISVIPSPSPSPSHSSFPHPDDSPPRTVLHPVPYRVYSGHRADVTSLDFSKDENFLLSASIDKTVRLWHVSSSRCIRIFPHPEIVTSVSFHPIQHRYFISGSFDNRIRLWNILEHRVVEWAQTAHFVTAVTFSPSGAMVVAGLHHGQCVFYQTNGLKYYTQIDCRNRSGKFKKGKKITGLEYSRDGKLLLVSTNDSRVRCYRLVDFSLVCKMKGVENEQLQIRATWSEDGQHVIMGSDKEYVAVWRMPQGAAGGGGGGGVGGSAGDKERSKTTSQSSRSTSVSTPSATSPLSPLSPLAQSISSPASSASTATGTAPSSSSSSASSSSSSLKLDAFEFFRAMDDTVTCAIFLPRPTLAWSSANEGAYVMPLRSIVLTTGLGGEIKVYENRLARPTGHQPPIPRR